MRLSEIITIYLATGAPFSVSCFMRMQNGEPLVYKLVRSAAIAFLWPLTVVKILLTKHVASNAVASIAIGESRASKQDTKVQVLKLRLLSTLHGMSELATSTDRSLHDDLERSACVLRDSIETYVGLGFASKNPVTSSRLDENIKELLLAAGYETDELEVAAACVNRRNNTRVSQHHTRARSQIIHAIADIRDAIERRQDATSTDEKKMARLRAAIVDIFNQANDLFVLFGDENATDRLVGLINLERRMRPVRSAAGSQERHLISFGEKPCSEHTSRITATPLSNESIIAQR